MTKEELLVGQKKLLNMVDKLAKKESYKNKADKQKLDK